MKLGYDHSQCRATSVTDYKGIDADATGVPPRPLRRVARRGYKRG
jgi:hypothetical protein